MQNPTYKLERIMGQDIVDLDIGRGFAIDLPCEECKQVNSLLWVSPL